MADVDRLGEIFARQLRLQRESFGVDPFELEGRDRREYLTQNMFAIVAELVEAADAAHWKMWANVGELTGQFRDRDAFVKECVDVVHFVVNLLLLAGCDDTEVYNRYMKKADVNERRQADGYDGISNKDFSGSIGRALDEPD